MLSTSEIVIHCRRVTMSKSSKVLSRRAREAEPPVRTAAVRAVADSTQGRTGMKRKSTRKRKVPNTDASDDCNQVSESETHRTGKASKRGVENDKGTLKQKGTVSKMGRQIPLTFTVQGKTQCEVIKAESSNELPLHAIRATEDDSNTGDSNVLMREWLERRANKGNLPGLQWYDKSRQLIRISWKHGSKSCWTTSDSQVFISWAQCTGGKLIVFFFLSRYFFGLLRCRYNFALVCWFVCQQGTDVFSLNCWNSWAAMRQETVCWTLGVISIQLWIQKFIQHFILFIYLFIFFNIAEVNLLL